MDCRTKQHWTCVVLMFMFSWTENALTVKASLCSCYTFNTAMENWENSKMDCRNNASRLVSMETEGEWKFINDKIQNIHVGDGDSDNEWYIGLTKTTGAEWRWISGQSLTINKWQPNKPDNEDIEQYVVMAKNWPTETQGLFNDIGGRQAKAYICEYSKVDSSDCIGCYRNSQVSSTTAKPVTSKSTKLTVQSSTTDVPPTKLIHSVKFTTQQVQITSVPTSKHSTSKKPPDASNYSTPSATNYPTSRISTSKTSTQKRSVEQQYPKDSFPLVSIVIVIGVLFVVFMCLVITTCYWRTRKKEKRQNSADIPNEIPDTSQQDDKKQNRVDVPTAAAITNITEVIEDSSFVAFTMVHNNLTQTKPPKTEDPVYASVSTGNNGVSMETPLTTNSDETQEKQGVVYASVDKTKKMNTKKNKAGFVGSRRTSKERFKMNEVSQTVSLETKEVVYASVDKSAKNRDKQQQPQITYADLAEFKNNASGVLKPTPYQPVEYAVIIGKSNSN